ncbi:MAG: O-antigen ligase family protein [Dehalococcoidia bacterium]
MLFLVATMLTGVQSIRPLFGLTVSDDLLLISLVLTAVGLTSGDARQGTVPNSILWGLQIFAIGALISAFGSPFPIVSLGYLMRFAFVIIAWVWLACTLLTTPAHIRMAISFWVFSIALSGAAAIAQILWGNVIPGTSMVWGRATGFAQHVNDLGGMTAVAIPAAIYLASTATTVRARVLAVVGGLLICAGLLLSGSVGGLLAAGGGTLAYFVLSGMSRGTTILLCFVLIAVVALVQFQASQGSTTPLERVEAVQRQGGTISTRLETFDAALKRIAKNPLIGVGLGAGPQETRTSYAVHNMFLGTWFEGGIIAVAGLIFLVGNILAIGLKGASLSSSSRERLICNALIASFVAYLILSLGAPTLFARYGWMPATLLLAWVLQLKHASVTNTASETPIV